MRTLAQIETALEAHDKLDFDAQWFVKEDALIKELSHTVTLIVAAQKKYNLAVLENEEFVDQCVDRENAGESVSDQNTVEFWEAMLASLQAGVELRKEGI